MRQYTRESAEEAAQCFGKKAPELKLPVATTPHARLCGSLYCIRQEPISQLNFCFEEPNADGPTA